jgi:phosphatidylserine/phosphatidylglycerophosphate/cardiolipin synthase-like enzyme/uncharacterized membrane protein YdjX (TVP38/TMEM64 family)
VILEEGRNCWRVARARRAAFLIDAAAYFSVLEGAIARAQRQLFIVGWDVDSRVRLAPRAAIDLLGQLNGALARRPELQAFVLGWDFSLIFTFERELLPSYRFAARAHPRLRFKLDGAHPVGASHHQKVVVVDDRIAFAGGLDLAARRWDTPQHLAVNDDRVDPAGQRYLPIHDVQMAVDGDAARALGQLARDRWRAATGEVVPPPPEAPAASAAGDPWPADLPPDVADAAVGIARTSPAADGAPEVREVLHLTLDAVAAAERAVYVENQYLTSAAVGRALAARLQEAGGPEIAIVLPREECGWLERSSMGIMRARLLTELRRADRFGRLRLLYPVVPGLNGRGCLNVHAKVLVIDDRLLRIGSSNLSNRSMGLDTECDLAIDAADDRRARLGVASLRDRLLAEHLGTAPATVAREIARRGSLLRAIDHLRGGERTLTPLPPNGAGDDAAAAPLNLAMMDGLVCDPERPAPDKLIEQLVPTEYRRPFHRSLLRYAALLVAVAGVAATWRFTPLHAYLDLARVVALGQRLRGSAAAPLLVLGAYVGGALLFFPITLMLASTALVFGPRLGFVYGLGGALAGALVTYGAGRLLGRSRARWLEGPRLARVRRHLQRRGLAAVVTARVLPVGNFTVINMVAGAVPIRLRDYVLGNILGLLPGLVGLTIFADRLRATLTSPRPGKLLLLVAVVAVLCALLGGLRRALARHARRHGPASAPAADGADAAAPPGPRREA